MHVSTHIQQFLSCTTCCSAVLEPFWPELLTESGYPKLGRYLDWVRRCNRSSLASVTSESKKRRRVNISENQQQYGGAKGKQGDFSWDSFIHPARVLGTIVSYEWHSARRLECISCTCCS